MGDCRGVDDMEDSEYVSGSTVLNHIRMGVVCFFGVIALVLLAIVARSSFTRAGSVLISFKNTGLGFMTGPGVLAIFWPKRF